MNFIAAGIVVGLMASVVLFLNESPHKNIPKYNLHQAVNYEVNSFYVLQCSGKGTVEQYYTNSAGELLYGIQTPAGETMCPATMWVRENQIKDNKPNG